MLASEGPKVPGYASCRYTTQGMTVEITYTREDIEALTRYVARWWHLSYIPAGCLLAAVPGALLSAWLGSPGWALLDLFVALFCGLAWLARLPKQSPAFDPQAYGTYTLDVTTDFLVWNSTRGKGRWGWSCVEKVATFEDRLMLHIGIDVWMAPRHSFASQADFEAFQQAVRERAGEAAPLRSVAKDAPLLPGPLGPDVASVEVSFQSTPEDLQAVANRVRLPFHRYIDGRIGMGFGIGTGLQLASLLFTDLGWMLLVAGQTISMVSCAETAVYAGSLVIERWTRGIDFRSQMPVRLQLSREGLGVSTCLFEFTMPWEEIAALDRDDRYIYLIQNFDTLDTTPVPKRAFADSEACARFWAFASEWHAASLRRKFAHLMPEALGEPEVRVESGNPYQPPRTGETEP